MGQTLLTLCCLQQWFCGAICPTGGSETNHTQQHASIPVVFLTILLALLDVTHVGSSERYGAISIRPVDARHGRRNKRPEEATHRVDVALCMCVQSFNLVHSVYVVCIFVHLLVVLESGPGQRSLANAMEA